MELRFAFNFCLILEISIGLLVSPIFAFESRNILLPVQSSSTPEVHLVGLSECERLRGVVVVIDVLRAFTTAAYAFAAGASEIYIVSTIEEAFQLKKRFPKAVLIGESNGIKIGGFDFGNSPAEIAKQDLKGKTLIQRTSAGTQGVVRSSNAERLLVSSFVVAEATFEKIKDLKPVEINFVITGSSDGSEDLALANYLEAKLLDGFIDPFPYLEKVRNSPEGRFLSQDHASPFLREDLEAACSIDKFSFYMEVFRKDGLNILRAIH